MLSQAAWGQIPALPTVLGKLGESQVLGTVSSSLKRGAMSHHPE